LLPQLRLIFFNKIELVWVINLGKLGKIFDRIDDVKMGGSFKRLK
jgi:hypothetical protein